MLSADDSSIRQVYGPGGASIHYSKLLETVCFDGDFIPQLWRRCFHSLLSVYIVEQVVEPSTRPMLTPHT